MSNSFERHGLSHLSASQINLFSSAPSLWLLEKILKVKGRVGCSAHRGSSVEGGVSHGLFDHSASEEDCVAKALSQYDRLTALSGDDKRDKERNVIPGMVKNGLALRDKGNPIRPNQGDQHRIEVMIEGVPIPFLGYLDFEFATEVIDTKTTNAIPSAMPAAHARQFSLYKTAKMEKRMRGAYISSKRMDILTLDRDTYDRSMIEITVMAKRMEKFLSVSDDPQELAAIVSHDPSTFYWSDPAMKAEGVRVFGF